MKTILFGSCGVLMASLALAGEVDVPNQFAAGTAAVAAQVNENFAALEAAVDDNAQAIETNAQAIDSNAQDITALQDGLGTAGISVRLDGVLIGRFLGHANPGVDVNVAPSAGTGIVEVAEAVGLVNTGRIGVISPTGYVFGIATSDFDNPSRLSEGELGFAPIFFDAASCMGNRFLPVEGPTGFFSTFELGSGFLRPVKRWSYRQGVVFASPDPTDPNPVYMIRRGQNAQTVPLQSVLLWFTATEQLVCVEVMNFPGFDISLPDPFDNSAFAVEPVDAVETGVAGTLGGAITIGF